MCFLFFNELLYIKILVFISNIVIYFLLDKAYINKSFFNFESVQTAWDQKVYELLV